jgi:hypothetical protein
MRGGGNASIFGKEGLRRRKGKASSGLNRIRYYNFAFLFIVSTRLKLLMLTSAAKE